MAFRRRDTEPEEPLPSFEELAAEARQNGADAAELLKQLARKLTADLGDAVEPTYYDAHGKEERKDPRVRYLIVKMPGQDHYSLWWEGGGISAKIRGQNVPLADWFVGLKETLAISAAEQRQGLEAMSATLEGRPLLSDVADVQEMAEVEPGPLSRPSSLAERTSLEH